MNKRFLHSFKSLSLYTFACLSLLFVFLSGCSDLDRDSEPIPNDIFTSQYLTTGKEANNHSIDTSITVSSSNVDIDTNEGSTVVARNGDEIELSWDSDFQKYHESEPAFFILPNGSSVNCKGYGYTHKLTISNYDINTYTYKTEPTFRQSSAALSSTEVLYIKVIESKFKYCNVLGVTFLV